MTFSVQEIREEFPILKQLVHGKPLVYLDNAATTQKPQVVIDALVQYYTQWNSNVHRGAHYLSDLATEKFEQARDTVAQFIHAYAREEVIWTGGTTESINRVAKGMEAFLQPGDEVIVTELEHHANLVTWQMACKATQATLKVVPILDHGELDVAAFRSLVTEKTAFVSMPHVSNALGTVLPIKKLIQVVRAQAPQARVLVDGAQGIAHCPVDVQELDCDFYAFSSHKVFGPTGIGVLWGRKELLENWPVWLTGGEMIEKVTYQDATWGELPYRLEAGTPNIAGAIGLATALSWYGQLDLSAAHRHEKELFLAAKELGKNIDGLRLIGDTSDNAGVYSFVIDGIHPADIGFLLDKEGVAIRTGDHCAQPLMRRLNVPGTVRASFSVYNTLEEVEALFAAIQKAKTMLA